MHEGQRRSAASPASAIPSRSRCWSPAEARRRLGGDSLLHDTVEDTLSTYSEVALRFGEEIAQLVDGVTKLTNLSSPRATPRRRRIPQAPDGDVEGPAGPPREAGRPPANRRTISTSRPKSSNARARPWTSSRRSPAAWACSRCATSSRHRLQGAEPRGAQVDYPPLRQVRRECGNVIAKITEDIRTVLRKAKVDAEVWDGRRSPDRSGARWRRRKRPSRGSPTSTGSASSPVRSGSATSRSARSTSAGGRCRGGSRTISPSRSRTATPRSTPPSRVGAGKRVEVGFRTREMHRSPRPASRPTGPTGTASVSRTRSRSIIRAGSARSLSGLRGQAAGQGVP